MKLIDPLPKANLAADVEMLVRSCIDQPRVTSLELLVSHNLNCPCRRCTGSDQKGTPLDAMDQWAFTTVGLLVREMRRNGRSIDFVGLTNTQLTDSDVLYLVGVLEFLLRPQAGLHMRPSPQLEIKQTTLSAPVCKQLMAAGN